MESGSAFEWHFHEARRFRSENEHPTEHGAACKQRRCLCWHPLEACSYRCLHYLHQKAYCLAYEMYIVLTVVKCAAIVMAVQFAQFGISRLCAPCWSLLGISKGKVDLDAIG
ncbi:unnamed protein product [Miscanthus lutarioriparius]|uniref:Uncharacterized protein n=1 Tax=Miscanthus lutarioriparius TaxID=422564 RepID=A0A811P8R5_9POAL|nr:unnamed protein product [Miscanthus lutarioriparius]